MEIAKFLVIAVILSQSMLSIGQVDSIADKVYKEEIEKRYNRLTIPDALIDSCNAIWKINESIWFTNWKGRPLGPDKDNSKNVSICYRTENYVVVFYKSYTGHSLEPCIMILDLNYKLVLKLSSYKDIKNIKQLLLTLKSRGYSVLN